MLAVTAVLAAAGSWPTPDTNESHYLCKARHAWDPTWCAGDFFLESPEAHQVFYRLLGPPAARLPLPVAAWLGRIAGWLTIAAGLCLVADAVMAAGASEDSTDGPGGGCGHRRGGAFVPAVLLAALYSLAVRHTTASGEWVIGGCEGKVFAWGLVLLGAGFMAAGRPASAWLSLACAAVFHVLVGGWSLVAWLGAVAWDHVSGRPSRPWGRKALVAFGLGTTLAVAAILPALALSRGVSAADAAEATRIYVVDRLPHHLLVRTFAEGMVSRHVLAAGFAFALAALVVAGGGSRSLPLQRLAVFVGAAVAIAAAGCGIALLESPAPRITYGLMRYYWFRLSDGLVPLLLACGLLACLRRPRRGMTGWLPIVAVAALVTVDLARESRHWPLPGRWIPSRADRHVEAAAWEEACRWIAANTPTDAVFLTPRGSATFQWRTGRAEVVSWKHVPQSLAGILEWRRRIDDCFARPEGGRLATSTVDLGPERVREVAARYGAGWIVVPRDATTSDGSMTPPSPGRVVYENTGYAIYDLKAPAPGAGP